MSDEFLPLVDEAGQVVGRALRSQCHGDPALIHPVVHLHVMDGRGRLLIQHRSSTKDLLPGYWDSAVGGHVSSGEEPAQALARETREELGIDAAGARFLYAYLWRGRRETEYARAYLLEYEGPFQIDPDEVTEVRYCTRKEINVMAEQGLLTPNLEEELRRLQEHGVF
jgi:isopentenyl-diphosphate delta-isomerase type 1